MRIPAQIGVLLAPHNFGEEQPGERYPELRSTHSCSSISIPSGEPEFIKSRVFAGIET
jgi:hypothetical protein